MEFLPVEWSVQKSALRKKIPRWQKYQLPPFAAAEARRPSSAAETDGRSARWSFPAAETDGRAKGCNVSQLS